MKLKRLLSALLALAMLAGICVMGITVSAEGDLPFIDVKNNWTYEPIKYVYEAGLMNGTGNGTTFSPNDNLTRGMAVTVLYRNDGSKNGTYKNPFVDVVDGKYYSVAACWAFANGIVNGTGTDEWGDPYFSPEQKITRQELATMFARYAAFKYIDTTKKTADISKFPDNGKVAGWATDAVKWAVGTELITGKANGGVTTLAPKDNASRAEFAAIIQRYNKAVFEYVHAYAEPVYSTYTVKDYPLVTDADIYVAVDGNDSNPGTLEAPLATFDAARLKVRELKKTAKDEIKVAFKEGEYGPITMQFTEEDAGTKDIPITYCAYGDGEVTFTNGFDINSKEFVKLDEKDKAFFRADAVANIYKVDVSDRLSDDVDISAAYLFSETSINNPARFPNKGSEDVYLSNYFERVDDTSVKVLVQKDRLDAYHTFEGVQLIGHFMYEWSTANMNVASYDKETGVISLSGSPVYGISPDSIDLHIYINNVSEELDTDGEFWIDRENKTLYVYKPEGNYTLATHGTFIDIQHADFLSFVRLNFNATTSKAMHIYANDITLKECTVKHVAGDIAIRFDNSGVERCTVDSCEFAYIAGNVIRVDGNSFDLYSDENKFINNSFHDFCIVYSNGFGLQINNCFGTVVAHNEFYNAARAAINVYGSIDCIIEYNVFRDVMRSSGDGGALYFGGTRRGRENIVRHNIFMNIPEGSGIFTIYLDDGTCAQIIHSNLFYNAGDFTIMVSGGRENEIYDNMAIYTENYNNSFGIWTHDKYYNMQNTGELDPDRWGEVANEYVEMREEKDPAALEFYKTRFPEVFTMILTFEDYKNPNCMIYPKNYYSKNYVIGTTHQITQSGLDCSTLIDNKDGISLDTNDFFVNPSIGDYTLKDGADFADLEFEKIGRY